MVNFYISYCTYDCYEIQRGWHFHYVVLENQHHHVSVVFDTVDVGAADHRVTHVTSAIVAPPSELDGL